MIWFFTRHSDRTWYEIRVAFEDGTYELIVRTSSGVERREPFTSEKQLLERRDELEESLRADGWRDDADKPWRPKGRIHTASHVH